LVSNQTILLIKKFLPDYSPTVRLNACFYSLTDEDSIPEVEGKAVSQLGDVWVCGNHRLLCGDSTDPVAMQKLLAGSLADMVFTDPPYNVNYGATIPRPGEGDAKEIIEFLAISC
jgi:hypothetical protein